MLKTCGLSVAKLESEELSLILPSTDNLDLMDLGEIAKSITQVRGLPLAIEVRFGNWIFYHAYLPGSTSKNQVLLDRKARVVLLKYHSTLYERISAQERGINCYKEHNSHEDTHAIHGGGLPLISKNDVFIGSLLISGLHHVEDHLFVVDVLSNFLVDKGESL